MVSLFIINKKTMTKLKIDLQNGIIDIEGEESFVTQIYNDFKEKINARYESLSLENKQLPPLIGGQEKKSSKPRSNSLKKTARSENFMTTEGIDATGLKKFFSEKRPKTKYENNAVFVYFLQKEQKITKITLNHIYTCYKLVNIKVPKALKQSLIDTAFHKKYLLTTDLNNITVTIVGENFVEHDLPAIKTK